MGLCLSLSVGYLISLFIILDKYKIIFLIFATMAAKFYYVDKGIGKVNYYRGSKLCRRTLNNIEVWFLENGVTHEQFYRTLKLTRSQMNLIFERGGMDRLLLSQLQQIAELCDKPVGACFDALEKIQVRNKIEELTPHEVKLFLTKHKKNIKRKLWEG